MTGIADVWAALREERPTGSSTSGLALMVASAAAFALMAAIVKKLLPDTPVQAIVFSRGVLMTAVFTTLASWRGAPIIGKRPGMLLLRGLLGYAALSCYFYSAQRLPLGDAVLLQYSHPIFVAAMAPWLLSERTGRGYWPLVLAALGGVALIVHPSGELRPAALVGLIGSILAAFAYLSVRELSRSEHPLTILVWFPLASIPLSFIGTFIASRDALPGDASDVAGHLLVTLLALVGQIAITVGLSRAGAAQATAVTLTGPVFGLLFGYLLFGTVPSAVSFAGTAIVLTTLGILGWRR